MSEAAKKPNDKQLQANNKSPLGVHPHAPKGLTSFGARVSTHTYTHTRTHIHASLNLLAAAVTATVTRVRPIV